MKASPTPMKRRRLLQVGTGAALVLAAGGGAAWLWRPGWRTGRLSESGRSVLRAIARVVLEGSLPADSAAQAAALDRHLDRVSETVAGYPKVMQSEWAQLLGWLSLAPGRRWLSGLQTDWDEASVGELEAALRRMRNADPGLKQQAYFALRELTNTAFFSEPANWVALGYPGPSAV